MKPSIENYFLQAQALIQNCITEPLLLQNIEHAGQMMALALDNGKKILACGNGGSMGDSVHFVAELVGRYKETRDPLPAIALSDPAAMSCIANDFGYDHVFRRQVMALGNRGDVLLAITTSGKSENVVKAILQAKEKGMKVIALTGQFGITNGGGSYCDVEIKIPSVQSGMIQQVHIMIVHLLVEIIESEIN